MQWEAEESFFMASAPIWEAYEDNGERKSEINAIVSDLDSFI